MATVATWPSCVFFIETLSAIVKAPLLPLRLSLTPATAFAGSWGNGIVETAPARNEGNQGRTRSPTRGKKCG